jgi:hypothetical protein
MSPNLTDRVTATYHQSHQKTWEFGGTESGVGGISVIGDDIFLYLIPHTNIITNFGIRPFWLSELNHAVFPEETPSNYTSVSLRWLYFTWYSMYPSSRKLSPLVIG